jgi:DNA-directed RNA polymerase subunit RPC12/RpoP
VSLNPNLRRFVEMADKNLVCKDCSKEFVFTEGEQEFYKEKGFENEPQRCPDCRRARKQQRNNDRGFRR